MHPPSAMDDLDDAELQQALAARMDAVAVKEAW